MRRTDIVPGEEVVVMVGAAWTVSPTLTVELDFACAEVKLGELANGTDSVVMELIVEDWAETALSSTLTVELDSMVFAGVKAEGVVVVARIEFEAVLEI